MRIFIGVFCGCRGFSGGTSRPMSLHARIITQSGTNAYLRLPPFLLAVILMPVDDPVREPGERGAGACPEQSTLAGP